MVLMLAKCPVQQSELAKKKKKTLLGNDIDMIGLCGKTDSFSWQHAAIKIFFVQS